MITVALTRAALARKGACAAGLQLFDEALAVQNARRLRGAVRATDTTPAHYEGTERAPLTHTLRVQWTVEAQLGLATVHPGFAHWLVWVGLVPPQAAPGANLASANLDGARVAPGSAPPAGWVVEPLSCGCCAQLHREVQQ